MTLRQSPQRARLGVSLMFFTNGVLFSALLPRYPEVKAAFELSNTAFGLVVIALPLGAIAAAGAAAPVIRRVGTRTVTAVGSLLLAGLLAVAGAAAEAGSYVALFVAAMFLAGLFDAIVDAAQNVQGVVVERWLGRSIINSLHAVWSLGAASGGLIGAWAAAHQIDLGTQMLVNGAVWAAVAVLASLLAATPDELRTPGAEATHATDATDAADEVRERRAPVSLIRNAAAWRLLAPLVVLAICGTLIEDVANNWAVLFLRQEGHASIGVASLGVTVVLACQFVGRILGDPMTDRWGREAVARSGGLLIATGFLLAMVAPGYVLAFVGFGLAGLGSATLVPAAFAAAGRVPGLLQGTGIAMLGWLMRLGFLITSPVIGVFSDAAGLRLALIVPMAAGLVAAFIAHATGRHREEDRAREVNVPG